MTSNSVSMKRKEKQNEMKGGKNEKWKEN